MIRIPRIRPVGLPLIILFLLGSGNIYAQPTATEIIRRADQKMRGETMQAVETMTIVRPDWDRTIKFRVWMKGDEKAFIRILEPPKEAGMGFLKLEGEMWQYVPKINRTIKIPPSMMMQSWMGSDFTNDDLVKEFTLVQDYTHALLGTERLRGSRAYRVELVPKENAVVSWGQIHYWVRASDFVPMKAVYFNQRGERVRTMIFTEIQEMDGRVVPTHMEVIDEQEEGHKTVIDYQSITYDEPIDDSIFTRRNLERAR